MLHKYHGVNFFPQWKLGFFDEACTFVQGGVYGSEGAKRIMYLFSIECLHVVFNVTFTFCTRLTGPLLCFSRRLRLDVSGAVTALS
jgi:hypothetical protein